MPGNMEMLHLQNEGITFQTSNEFESFYTIGIGRIL